MANPRFSITLPTLIDEILSYDAAKNGRSKSKQVEWIIRQHYDKRLREEEVAVPKSLLQHFLSDM